MVKLNCVQCHKDFFVKKYLEKKQKFCSRECMGKSYKGKIPSTTVSNHEKMKGSGHWNWRGGKVLNSQGYVLIYSPNHPHKDNQNKVREHRLVMEKHLGRYLLPDEDVHHINGIKTDNRIENLELCLKSDHIRLFHKKKKTGYYKKCLYCNKDFYVSKCFSRILCCSQHCSAKLRWISGKSSFGR